MPRVFVAAWPPQPVVDLLLALPRPDLLGLRWIPGRNLHVTLRFLGDAAPDRVLDRLRDADLPRCTATLGPVTERLGRRIVMAPVAGLGPLAAAVTGATADLGEPPPARPFVGHVTLARARDDAAAQRASGSPVAGSWAVTTVAVVTSETHPDGARYATVDTTECT